MGPRPPQNFPPQFNTFAPRPNNMPFNPRFGPPPMIAPQQNPQPGQRMDFRGITPLNFRPPYQNNIQRPGNRLHFTQHGQAVSRPNFMPNGPPPNGPPFPPYNQQNPQMMGHFEPNGPMMYNPSRPPFRCPTSPYPGPPRHEAAPSHLVPSGLPAIVPRKVLINPNFKGGVQAATSKFSVAEFCCRSQSNIGKPFAFFRSIDDGHTWQSPVHVGAKRCRIIATTGGVH